MKAMDANKINQALIEQFIFLIDLIYQQECIQQFLKKPNAKLSEVFGNLHNSCVKHNTL